VGGPAPFLQQESGSCGSGRVWAVEGGLMGTCCLRVFRVAGSESCGGPSLALGQGDDGVRWPLCPLAREVSSRPVFVEKTLLSV